MSAPASQAALASGQLVMPQILTRIMAWLDRQLSPAQKICESRRGIGRKHKTFTDKKSVEACASEPDEIVVGAETRFADGHAAIWNALDQLEGSFDAEFESFQIAIIHADDAGFGRERAVELRGGVNFHNRFHLQLAAESD